MTCSRSPLKRLRSTGSCVATPTGHVFRWHLRIMMQPAAISGAVANPNSSAPSSAPITTPRPVRKAPSALSTTPPRTHSDPLGPEQRPDPDVPPGAEAAVDLNHDAAAQPLAHQRLMGFGKADFPRRTCVLDRGEGGCAGAALEACDGEV